jgi:stage II sporulation protein AA (anti-sigma F factor antagonist)
MIDRIIFDFTRTAFMDSSGIGVLLGRYKEMRAAGGRVSYYGAGKQVKRILEISGINRLVSGYEKKEQALKSER